MSASQKTGLASLTPSDTKLLLLGALCTPGAKVDYDKLSELSGIKRASAGTMYSRAKMRLEKIMDTKASGSDTPSKEKKPAKRRKLTAAPPDDESESELEAASEADDELDTASNIDEELPHIPVKNEPVD